MIHFTSGPWEGSKTWKNVTVGACVLTGENGIMYSWAVVWPERIKYPFYVFAGVLGEAVVTVDAPIRRIELYNRLLTPQYERRAAIADASRPAPGKKVRVSGKTGIVREVKISQDPYTMSQIKVEWPDNTTTWHDRSRVFVSSPENYLVGVMRCDACNRVGTTREIKAKIKEDREHTKTVYCGECLKKSTSPRRDL